MLATLWPQLSELPCDRGHPQAASDRSKRVGTPDVATWLWRGLRLRSSPCTKVERVATESRSSSNRSAYTSRLVAAEACPSMRWTAFTFAPALIARLAAGAGPEVGAAKHASIGAREHEVVPPLPDAALGERSEEQRGERHRSAYVRLGAAPHEPSSRLGHRLRDFDSSSTHLEPTDSQRGRLVPPQTRAAQNERDISNPVLPAREHRPPTASHLLLSVLLLAPSSSCPGPRGDRCLGPTDARECEATRPYLPMRDREVSRSERRVRSRDEQATGAGSD